jgi:LysR family pca operon transcriptional activator
MVAPSSAIAARLKFRHMRFMLALAETGSMARTAERLSVSYPAVVKTRLEIEEAPGGRLLTGRGDASALTEIGACLAEASRRILSELDCASEELAALRDGLHGHVIVGVRSLDALRWLAPAVVGFRQRFPGVTLSLVDGLHQDIARGDVDIGLARVGPAHHHGELSFARLFAIKSVVVGSGMYARQADTAPEWQTLVGQDWCLPPSGTPLRDRLDGFIQAQGLGPPASVLEISDMTAQVEMLSAGSFLAVSSEEVAHQLMQRNSARIVVPVLPALDDHIALIWRTESRLHPAVAQLKHFLLEWLNNGDNGDGFI